MKFCNVSIPSNNDYGTILFWSVHMWHCFQDLYCGIHSRSYLISTVFFVLLLLNGNIDWIPHPWLCSNRWSVHARIKTIRRYEFTLIINIELNVLKLRCAPPITSKISNILHFSASHMIFTLNLFCVNKLNVWRWVQVEHVHWHVWSELFSFNREIESVNKLMH